MLRKDENFLLVKKGYRQIKEIKESVTTAQCSNIEGSSNYE